MNVFPVRISGSFMLTLSRFYSTLVSEPLYRTSFHDAIYKILKLLSRARSLYTSLSHNHFPLHDDRFEAKWPTP
jgi:hypothetical protein